MLFRSTLAIAYTNLGNIRFRRGDEVSAMHLYRRAIEVDPRQPEAHYNLGYVMLEATPNLLTARIFAAICSAGTTDLPDRCPQRFGISWSSR